MLLKKSFFIIINLSVFLHITAMDNFYMEEDDMRLFDPLFAQPLAGSSQVVASAALNSHAALLSNYQSAAPTFPRYIIPSSERTQKKAHDPSATPSSKPKRQRSTTPKPAAAQKPSLEINFDPTWTCEHISLETLMKRIEEHKPNPESFVCKASRNILQNYPAADMPELNAAHVLASITSDQSLARAKSPLVPDESSSSESKQQTSASDTDITTPFNVAAQTPHSDTNLDPQKGKYAHIPFEILLDPTQQNRAAYRQEYDRRIKNRATSQVVKWKLYPKKDSDISPQYDL